MVAYKLTINKAAATQTAKARALRLVTDTTRQVLNRCIVLTPVRTGNLRTHNRMRVYGRASAVIGEVYNTAAYAGYVHDGTAAHTIRPRSTTRKTIRPKNAKAFRFVIGGRVVYAKSIQMTPSLRFTIRGRVVYAKSVRIPAHKGRPWMAQALREIAVPAGYTVTKL